MNSQESSIFHTSTCPRCHENHTNVDGFCDDCTRKCRYIFWRGINCGKYCTYPSTEENFGYCKHCVTKNEVIQGYPILVARKDIKITKNLILKLKSDLLRQEQMLEKLEGERRV